MANKTFTGKNVKAFITWLAKFSSVSKEGILEADLETQEFSMKVFNDERSVIKGSKLSFETAEMYTNENSGSFKVGLRVITNLTKVLNNFSGEDFKVTFHIEDDTDEVSAIKFSDKSSKINVNGASLSNMVHLSDERFYNDLTNIGDEYTEFTLSPAIISKINNLSAFDTNNLFLKLKVSGNQLIAEGESFELIVCENPKINSDITSICISKKQLSMLDAENYGIHMLEDRLICTSCDSETIAIIAKFDAD